MKQQERSSIMRLVSDMVKSDAIIDMREIEFVNDIKAKYGITQDDEIASENISMAEAFGVLREASETLQKDLLGDLQRMALSDNACTREEAMLLLAFAACFNSKTGQSSNIYSIEVDDKLVLDNSQVLYVEGEYYKETNREIDTSYRAIINELRLVGLNFVYLPKVGEHYRSLPSQDLNNLISFLYPNISEKQMKTVAKQLYTLSTSDFCKTEIVERMNMNELQHSLPSVMFRLGSSRVANKKLNNFLVITIEDDAYTTIKNIVDAIYSNFSPRILNPIHETNRRFVYHGYYKQILDSFVYKKGIRSSVVVDLIHGEILLPEADTKVSGLHRREKALYALFLLESSAGGINFNKPTTSKALERYKHRMEVLQRKYEIIYENFGGERSKAPTIELPETRLPMLSLIKRCFRQLGDLLNAPDDYLVQRNVFGNYCVAIPPELCLCFDASNNTNVAFDESDFWSKLLAM